MVKNTQASRRHEETSDGNSASLFPFPRWKCPEGNRVGEQGWQDGEQMKTSKVIQRCKRRIHLSSTPQAKISDAQVAPELSMLLCSLCYTSQYQSTDRPYHAMSGQRRGSDAAVTFPWTSQHHTDVYPAVDPASPRLSLREKVVIITGVGEGIGRSVRAKIPVLEIACQAGEVHGAF